MTFYTVSEIAEKLKISCSKVFELVAGGEIVPHRIGGAIRISEDDFELYLAGCRVGTRKKKQRRAPSRRRLKHITLPLS